MDEQVMQVEQDGRAGDAAVERRVRPRRWRQMLTLANFLRAPAPYENAHLHRFDVVDPRPPGTAAPADPSEVVASEEEEEGEESSTSSPCVTSSLYS